MVVIADDELGRQWAWGLKLWLDVMVVIVVVVAAVGVFKCVLRFVFVRK
jgi:hypothetical protein